MQLWRPFTSKTHSSFSVFEVTHFYKCAIPAFDGLFPEPQNAVIMQLLFTAAHWHGLAKLRLHSETTLSILDNVTTSLGTGPHHFKDVVCPNYQTKELPHETKAHQRKKVKTHTHIFFPSLTTWKRTSFTQLGMWLTTFEGLVQQNCTARKW